MEDQSCPICLENFQIKDIQQQLYNPSNQDVYTLHCLHKFHFSCLKNIIGDKKCIKCPMCSTIYGQMIGDQPQGKMDVKICPFTKLQGYQKKGAIIITYLMQSGQRNGSKFSGTTRIAYLPNDQQGKQVLQLLRLAFDRKLIFTVGRSVSTGLDNQTVWNGIHHKTRTFGGSANFGFPDATYLKRVKQELATKGIIPQSLKNIKK